jgi:SulP family sulfate permease
MVEEAQKHSRKAYVVASNDRVRERLQKFSVEGLMSSRTQALETALADL